MHTLCSEMLVLYQILPTTCKYIYIQEKTGQSFTLLDLTLVYEHGVVRLLYTLNSYKLIFHVNISFRMHKFHNISQCDSINKQYDTSLVLKLEKKL